MAVNNTRQRVSYGLTESLLGVPHYPIVTVRNPTTSDKAPIGTLWVNKSINVSYVLTSIVANVATWTGAVGGDGDFATLSSTTTTDVGTDLTVGGDSALTGSLTVTGATAANGGLTVVGALSQTGGVAGIGTDATSNAINIGTGAAAKVITLGNITGATQLVMNAGSGASSLTTTNGTLALNTGTGTLSISSDASATTVNIGTGAAVKTIHIGDSAQANVVTIGSTTGAASTTIQGGTVGISLSAGGAVAVAANSPASTPLDTIAVTRRVSQVTFTGFTTAPAGSQTFTITNASITAASVILVTAMNLGADDAQMCVTRVLPGAGSAVITLQNFGAAALNGNVILNIWILQF